MSALLVGRIFLDLDDVLLLLYAFEWGFISVVPCGVGDDEGTSSTSASFRDVEIWPVTPLNPVVQIGER